ncbi:hypothetical protein ASD45_13475 [Pseudolabrys sp. Root1462]|jgi:hypothetical protein|uniref:hypothetical protein n=1 Tax=Pseudolabrys sp. Root1462 TaxID=1736466 RepID=UPI000702D476|nr:hypothetical protein [Pseudolabrys sp. Root1462]KQZ01751.1 hypothetical protein ASD45_13475 [Pseudolabrys sp. Root1462]
MSRLNKIAMAAGFMLTLGAVAFANDAGNWLMGPNQGYAVGKDGEPRIINLKIDDAMMARAQELQPGTVMFQHKGKVHMVFDRSLIGLGSR